MANTVIEYFSAINTYAGFDAHKKAEAFLAQKQSEGFVGYQSTYGQHGFSVTYWPKPEINAQSLSSRFNDPAYQKQVREVARAERAIRRAVK